jgi:hypothetical protein
MNSSFRFDGYGKACGLELAALLRSCPCDSSIDDNVKTRPIEVEESRLSCQRFYL